IATVAPSCGIPVESRTWPESFPALVMDLLEVCAASRGAHVTPRVEARRTPKHRSGHCFTRLPPRCNVRSRLLLHRILYRELGRAGDGGIGQQIGRVNLES